MPHTKGKLIGPADKATSTILHAKVVANKDSSPSGLQQAAAQKLASMANSNKPKLLKKKK